ncbi:hypothetical protein KCU65_g1784, partial [Aureobasidium melanogenum]
MDLVVATDGVAANVATTPTQDSAFLRLPLEIRHEIYSYLIHLKQTKTLSTEVTLDPASGLDPVTRLLGVSQQIRSEVHGLIAAVTTLKIEACESIHSTIVPYYIYYSTTKKFLVKAVEDRGWARECFRAGTPVATRDTLAKMIKDEKKAPHQLKFWKICIPVGSLFMEPKYAADVDFRARAVHVYTLSSEEPSDDPDSDYWLTKKEAFTNAMRFFTEQDKFEGITIADMSLFLDKVALGLGQTIPQ